MPSMSSASSSDEYDSDDADDLTFAHLEKLMMIDHQQSARFQSVAGLVLKLVEAYKEDVDVREVEELRQKLEALDKEEEAAASAARVQELERKIEALQENRTRHELKQAKLLRERNTQLAQELAQAREVGKKEAAAAAERLRGELEESRALQERAQARVQELERVIPVLVAQSQHVRNWADALVNRVWAQDQELLALRAQATSDREDLAHLRAQAGRDEEANECCVCLDSSTDTALSPCGHCLCKGCAPQFVGKGCPTCSASVDGAMKLFGVGLGGAGDGERAHKRRRCA